jgi:hypothetical protein
VREDPVVIEHGRLLLAAERDDLRVGDQVLDLLVADPETCALRLVGHDLSVDQHVHDGFMQAHQLGPLRGDVLRAHHHHAVEVVLPGDEVAPDLCAFDATLGATATAAAGRGLRTEVDDEDCDHVAKQHVDEQRP